MTTVIKYPLRNLHPAVVRELQEKYPEAEVQIALNSDRLREGMTEDRFWALIALLDWDKTGDNDAVIKPVIAALAGSGIRDIYEFEDILSQKLFALDGLAYAQNIGTSAYQPGQYFSPDVFLYARCCAVANGRDLYYAALQYPEKMPRDLDFAPLLRIAEAAYTRKTGQPYHQYVPAFPVETYSNEAGWKEAP